jgi:hypothetical protein
MDILTLRKLTLIITLAVVIMLFTGCAMNEAASIPLDSDEQLEMKVIYEDNPAFFFKSMKLIWNDTIYHVAPISQNEQGAFIGFAADENSTWAIYELKGYDHDYLLAVESEDVWRVMTTHPSADTIVRQYILENATERQKLERMFSVSLFNDGTATLAIPPISSLLLFSPYYYTFMDDELMIHYERDNVIATFTVVNDDVIILKSATAGLFVDEGRYFVVYE